MYFKNRKGESSNGRRKKIAHGLGWGEGSIPHKEGQESRNNAPPFHIQSKQEAHYTKSLGSPTSDLLNLT